MAFEGFEEGFATTSLGKIFYLSRKNGGQPILFLHGIGGLLKSWDKLAPLLGQEQDIYLIDLLGHGRSDSPDIDYDVMVQVKVLKELVEQWGLERPVLFGHSYGGWMAVHYSLEKPTAGLIIEDSAGIESQQVEIRKLGKTKEDRDTLISSALLIGAHEHVVRSAADNFDKYLLTKEIMSKVSVKTSLIWGEEDEFVPVRFGREMNDAIKGSELLVIPDTGHVPHRTKPEVVSKAIAKFLEGL